MAGRLSSIVLFLGCLAALAAEFRAGANPARRYGRPAELGAYFAFLCSEHAGFITGQNLLIDGGSYPGTY